MMQKSLGIELDETMAADIAANAPEIMEFINSRQQGDYYFLTDEAKPEAEELLVTYAENDKEIEKRQAKAKERQAKAEIMQEAAKASDDYTEKVNAAKNDPALDADFSLSGIVASSVLPPTDQINILDLLKTANLLDEGAGNPDLPNKEKYEYVSPIRRSVY